MTSALLPTSAGRFAARVPMSGVPRRRLVLHARPTMPVVGGWSSLRLRSAPDNGARSNLTRAKLSNTVYPPGRSRPVCNLAIATLGFPAAMAGLNWVNDVIEANATEGEER